MSLSAGETQPVSEPLLLKDLDLEPQGKIIETMNVRAIFNKVRVGHSNRNSTISVNPIRTRVSGNV
jgi:hypothetical protein